MKIPYKGGCACGAIRYECTAEPMLMVNCHCRACQYSSGSSYATGIMLSTDSFKLRGEPRYYESRADSGNNLERAFCPDCGTPLFSRTDGNRDIVVIRASSLDDPSLFKPEMDIFTEAAQHWDYMNPELAKFPGMPGA